MCVNVCTTLMFDHCHVTGRAGLCARVCVRSSVRLCDGVSVADMQRWHKATDTPSLCAHTHAHVNKNLSLHMHVHVHVHVDVHVHVHVHNYACMREGHLSHRVCA